LLLSLSDSTIFCIGSIVHTHFLNTFHGFLTLLLIAQIGFAIIDLPVFIVNSANQGADGYAVLSASWNSEGLRIDLIILLATTASENKSSEVYHNSLSFNNICFVSSGALAQLTLDNRASHLFQSNALTAFLNSASFEYSHLVNQYVHITSSILVENDLETLPKAAHKGLHAADVFVVYIRS
jgi:hypothetical protein